ncbi:MAG: SLBB domain-containing protein [Leptospira sp.]|nr:SLBB domain-containing protein [Leptospira sp.]
MNRSIQIFLLLAGFCLGLYYWKENPDLRKTIYSEPSIRVKIDGAVAKPGVYELEAGSTGWDLVGAAGGLLPDARKSTEDSNLDNTLEDGQILILGKR